MMYLGASSSFYTTESASAVDDGRVHIAVSQTTSAAASQRRNPSRIMPSQSHRSPAALTPHALGGASMTAPVVGRSELNNSRGGSASAVSESGDSPAGRGSRYIPQRDENTSARFDLGRDGVEYCGRPSSSGSRPGLQPHQRQQSRVAQATMRHVFGSTSEGPDTQQSILSFTGRRPLEAWPNRSDAASRGLSSVLEISTRQRRSGAQANLSTMPHRILDAPNLKPRSQIVDWGADDRLVVALGESLFAWDAATNQASQLSAIPGADFTGVRWMQGGRHVVAALDTSACLIDVEMGDRVVQRYAAPMARSPGRNVFSSTAGSSPELGHMREDRVPPQITEMALSGPIVAIASDSFADNIALHDSRLPRSKIRSFDAHDGGTTSLSFLSREPYYLASGGRDGSVKVWDVRNASDAPRYSFAAVSRSRVTKLMWAEHKRSHLFFGTADGDIGLIDTHVKPQQAVRSRVVTGNGVSGFAASGDGKLILTSHVTGSDPRGGHLQVRRTDDLSPVGSFAAVHNTEPIVSLGFSADGENVVGAQMDESLKFWKVFRRQNDDTSRGPSNSGNSSMVIDELSTSGNILERSLR